MKLKRVPVFGFDFISAHHVSEVADELFNDFGNLSAHQYQFLITPNAYQLVHFNDDSNKALKDFYQHATYILPDGMPVVWVAGKKQLPQRLTGSDLFPVVWQGAKERDVHATFVLPNEHMSELFRKESQVCNCLVPDFFQPQDAQYISGFAAKVADAIITNRSVFVFLGLGFPKQELLAIQIMQKLKAAKHEGHVLFFLLGASFEFYFGMKDRAPVLFQKTGMEWLYRFAKEPRRLWKRYTVDNVRFISLALKEVFK